MRFFAFYTRNGDIKMKTTRRKNGWADKEGRVYIIFTIEEAMAAMGCANQKATHLLTELEKGIGLIERKRRGRRSIITGVGMLQWKK